jgi:hypothetical protein
MRSGGLRVLLRVAVIFFLTPHCDSLYFYVSTIEIYISTSFSANQDEVRTTRFIAPLL